MSRPPPPPAAPSRAPPDGAALVIAIVLTVVIECIVIGTVHLVILERRIADNSALALRLRLAAESTARLAAADWPPVLDSVHAGNPPVTILSARSVDGLDTYGTVERLGDAIYLVRAAAHQPAPHPGRAVAAILVLPPALRHGVEFASAAVSAASAAIGATAAVAAGDQSCGEASFAAVRLTGAALPEIHDAARLDGSVEHISVEASLTLEMPRIARTAEAAAAGGGSGIVFSAANAHIAEPTGGVLVAIGDVTIEAAASFHGLIIAGGSLTVEENGTVHGAAHAAGHAAIHGSIQLDACAVLEAVRHSAFDRPRPLPGRPWLPAF